MQRSSGIMMHISSLPSNYGIGTMGRCAFEFADFLFKAGQGYWQMLPMGPTGYGNSPYQSFSTHAGNPYFIDLDILKDSALLTAHDLIGLSLETDIANVDYKQISNNRLTVLHKAFQRGYGREKKQVGAFFKRNSWWLAEYSLFMAIKDYFGGDSWQNWPKNIRTRQPKALEQYRKMLTVEIDFYIYIQYLFFKQWDALKSYVNGLGIKIIGDLPIYVSPDSADVWANPKLFALDAERRPRWISGVPPDYFSQDGQLWGNPVYRWPAHRKTRYAWWIARIKSTKRFADIIRIDHFRGFYDYWGIPANAEIARTGKWFKGPGLEFIEEIRQQCPEAEIIAEDLGLLSDKVMQFVEAADFPGMKVLQFSFDASKPGRNAPHQFPEKSICYTGTHDNTTVKGWFQEGLKRDVDLCRKYLGLNKEEGHVRGFIRGGMACSSMLFITQMQDWLELDEQARMNIPGTLGDNWRWRMLPDMLTTELAKEISYITRIYGRSRRGDEMAKFDFDAPVNRRGSLSYKWDSSSRFMGEEEVIPMWVADMDFKCPKPMLDALQTRIEHGILGYTKRGDDYYDMIQNWLARRFNWKIKKEWISYCPPGVIPAVTILLNLLTVSEDPIIMHMPNYDALYGAVLDMGRKLIKCPLKLDKSGYHMDLELFEKLVVKHKVKVMVFCSPHNPTGRVWTKGELKQLGEICKKHGVFVISDEVHCDLVYEPNVHTPFGKLESMVQNSATLMSPNKSFNVGGLMTATVIIPNAELMSRYKKVLGTWAMNLDTTFGTIAVETLYGNPECEAWLDAVVAYLKKNVEYVTEYVNKNIKGVQTRCPEGTYLMWLDFSQTGLKGDALNEFLIKKAHIDLSSGKEFDPENVTHMRMNVACSFATVKEAMERLKAAVDGLDE